jgi:hypothetical protein
MFFGLPQVFGGEALDKSRSRTVKAADCAGDRSARYFLRDGRS